MLGIMVVLKLFSCFLFLFAYFCSLILLSVSTEMCVSISLNPLHGGSVENIDSGGRS